MFVKIVLLSYGVYHSRSDLAPMSISRTIINLVVLRDPPASVSITGTPSLIISFMVMGTCDGDRVVPAPARVTGEILTEPRELFKEREALSALT